MAEQPAEWLYNVQNSRVMPWTERLANEPHMVPCDKEGRRVDLPESDADSVIASLRAEVAGLKNQLEVAKSAPDAVVIADLRRSVQMETNRAKELEDQLAGTVSETHTIEVAGEVSSEPVDTSISSELEDFVGNTRPDKIALEAWAQERLQIDLDRRKGYEALVTECKEAISATMV